MRVLWFTNTMAFSLCPEDVRTSGGWMHAMLGALRGRQDLEIGVITAMPVTTGEHRCVDGIDAFVVPQPSRYGSWGLRRSLEACARIVQEWNPDLIHIYGTERFYGLLTARRLVARPAVISLQGLLGPYSEWRHFFGPAGWLEVARMHRLVEPLMHLGVGWGLLECRKSARQEGDIIRGNRHFLSYTTWDRSHVAALNPAAIFHDVADAVRAPFWRYRWSLDDCRRFRVVFTNSGHPRKGTEVLLEAGMILKDEFPDLQLCIGGTISEASGYGRYLRRRMRALGKHVVELGALNAEQVAQELTRAHVFVSPSFIENSPNAVCEAQLVGVPAVSSYTGGVPSLIEHGKTGLFFPNGDAPVLAARLRQLFLNDKLATSLSAQGRALAECRNATDKVVGQLVSAYESVAAEGAAGSKN